MENANGLCVPSLVERSQFFAQFRVSPGCGKITTLVTDVRGECFPIRSLGRTEVGKSAHTFVKPLSQGFIAQCRMIHADNRKLLRQASVQVQSEKRRDQLAPRQIPGSAKDDECDRTRLVSC